MTPDKKARRAQRKIEPVVEEVKIEQPTEVEQVEIATVHEVVLKENE
jgi:hypothetical protein